ncbi:MAG: bifunctional diguanylate cyclase/phosphodiesterase, partial [Sulfurimonas sp.]
ATHTIQQKLNSNIETILIEQAKSFAKNIDDELHKHIQREPYAELKQNPLLQKHLDDTLSIIVNDFFKYVFVLYRDDAGVYRYLLDGSDEKARFNKRLCVEKKYWDSVYTTKQPVIIKQSELESIWVTYLQPVIFDNEVKAVVAIDFSTQLPTSIYNAIEPLQNVFLYIFVAIGILVFILFYQTLLSLKNKQESITDALTRTYNRTFLRELVKDIDMSKYQIMMLDIDYFKQINDNYGHKAGDFVLRKTAQIISQLIREDDYLIRYGGEEFLLFIKKGENENTLALKIAERIRKKIEKTPFEYEDKTMRITVSIGLTNNPEHFKTLSLAIKHADEMLYRAKREGRNKVVSHDTNNTKKEHIERKNINEMKEALEEDRIICYFQAIVNVGTNKICKYEALARMIDKDGSIVLPYLFLDTLAHTNLYNDFTKRILELVFEKIKSKKVTISVNLNFSDILDNSIYKIILDELQKHQELTKWLTIELLEYEIMQESSLIQERLLEIKSFGVQIALDDFGSGFANYSVFETLPLDILKIDGSLIKNVATSKTSYTITHSIATLARELGIKTVAEFVHSKEVLEIVQELQIDEAQGFYIAKPSADI